MTNRSEQNWPEGMALELKPERDPYTMRHLDAWLDSQVNGDTCREECRAAMLALYDDDPEYWSSQAWTNLFDRTKCWDIVRRYM